MKKEIHINKKFAYLIILALVVVILYLIKLLFRYSFFQNIENAFFNIFFPFFISFAVVYIFHPVLYWFEKKFSIKTWVSTLMILLINIIIIIVLIEILVPIIAVQIKNIIVELPKYIDELEVYIIYLQDRIDIINNKQFYDTVISIKDTIVNNIGKSLINFAVSSVLFSLKSIWIIIFIPILIFIMMKDYSLIYKKTSQFLIKHKRSEWIQLLKNIDKKLGSYIRGQLIIMSYMFVGSFILLTIIGMPNALIFSLIIAVTNIIPYLGPFLGGIPLWIYAYFQSPYLLIASIIIIIIVQQFDSNVGNPIVFGSQSKIHPLIIMVVLLIGSAICGILGLFLAVPVYIIINEIFVFYKPKIKDKLKEKNLSIE